MAASPVIKQIAGYSYVVFWGLILLLAGLGQQITPLDFIECLLPAILLVYALGWALRNTLGKHQQQGMKHIRSGEFQKAIPCFEQSYKFFANRPWLDKWRFLLMLSISQVSYREMAQNNIAFSYAQLGDGLQARAYYQRVLAEFPDSGLAEAALRLLDAGSGLGHFPARATPE